MSASKPLAARTGQQLNTVLPRTPYASGLRPPFAGTWSQYGRSPSDGQRWYHREVTGLLHGDYEAYIAVVDCELVGREAWIQVWPWKRWLRAFVYDCSGHTSTTRWMRDNGILGELDYYTARKLGVPQGRGVRGAMSLQPQGVKDVSVDDGVNSGGSDGGRGHRSRGGSESALGLRGLDWLPSWRAARR